MEESHSSTAMNVGGDVHANSIKVLQRNVTYIIKPEDPLPKNVRFKVQKPIKTFNGRETFLDDLHKVVKEGQITVLTQTPLSVVAATGGIGKTETVRMYLQHHAHEYDHIVWIDAEDTKISKSQFEQLAMELKICAEFDGIPKEFESLLKEVFEKLLQNAHVVLLVFDNAEAFEDDPDHHLNGIKDFLPNSLSPFFVEPTVIVTSRQQTWSLHNVIHLDVWTEAEVVTFVIQRLGLKRTSKNEAGALRLGNLFGRLPIAMQSAVAVILQQIKRKKKYGIQSLIDEYESGCRKVLAQKPSDANMRPYESSITMLVLWNLSLEKIAPIEGGNLAIKILCFMAFLSSTGTPRDMLRSILLDKCTDDSFEAAIEILEDYSLVGISSSTSGESQDEDENEDDSVSHLITIHRMIQDVTIENLKSNVGQTMHPIFNKKTFLNDEDVQLEFSPMLLNFLKREDITKYARYKEFIESVINFGSYTTNNVHVKGIKRVTANHEGLNTIDAAKSVELLKTGFKDTQLQEPMDKVIEELELKCIDKSNNGGWLVQTLTESLKKMKEEFTQALDPEFADQIADIVSKKGDAYKAVLRRHEKNYKEAMEKCRIIMSDFKNMEDTDDKSTLAITKTFKNMMLDEGSELLTFLAEMRTELENIPDLPNEAIRGIRAALAYIQNALSYYIESRKLLFQTSEEIFLGIGPLDERIADKQVLFMLEKLQAEETQLGSEHPSTLLTRSNLALLYHNLGEFDKALPLLDLELCKRVLGPEHPVTFSTLTTLVSVMQKQKKSKEVLALLKTVYKIEKQTLGGNDPDTLNTMMNIGVAYSHVCEYDKAVKVAQDVLSLCEKNFQEDHYITIKARECLMNWKIKLQKQNKQKDELAKFIELTEADAEIGRSLLNDSDWNVEVALNNFYKLNPNLTIAESDDLELALALSQTALDEKNENEEGLARFLELTHVNAEIGRSHLQASKWNLEVAVDNYFNQKPDGDVTGFEGQGQDQALIRPRAATATDAQNQDEKIVTSDTAENNQIQGIEVKSEAAPKPKPQTTTISFRLVDGKNLRGEFCTSATVIEIYQFVNEQRPDFAHCSYVLTFYPNTELRKMEETLEEANLLNAALTQKLIKE